MHEENGGQVAGDLFAVECELCFVDLVGCVVDCDEAEAVQFNSGV